MKEYDCIITELCPKHSRLRQLGRGELKRKSAIAKSVQDKPITKIISAYSVNSKKKSILKQKKGILIKSSKEVKGVRVK